MSDVPPIPAELIRLQREVYAAQARARDAARSSADEHAARVAEEAARVALHRARDAYGAATGVPVLWWELRKAALAEG